MIVEKHSRMPRKYEDKVPAVEDKKYDPVAHAGLRGQDPKAILLRYLSDESTKDIAASYGVTRQTLGQWLMRHAEEDWKEAQVARAIARKERAEDNLETAADALELARNRELLKAAQWDLERTCKRIYGQEVQQQVIVTPVLNITLSDNRQPSVTVSQSVVDQPLVSEVSEARLTLASIARTPEDEPIAGRQAVDNPSSDSQ